MDQILVSICCQTYNHGKYLRECLNGFVTQKTTFAFEILVHEDASTDNTASILREYESKYHHQFRCVYQTENQFLKQNTLVNILFKMAKGKYIALCEGDDYWTDPHKLQKQVDFLEANAECNYVFTNRSTLKSDESIDQTDYNLPELFDLHFLLKQNIMPSTQTVLFRSSSLSQLAKWEPTLSKGFNGDWILLFMITQNSKIGFLKDNTAVYREGVGVISKTNNAYKFIKGLNTNKQIDYLTNYKYTYHIGVYDFHYQNITYSYLESNEKLKGLKWFFKTEFYKLFNGKSESFFTRNNWTFIKHSIKLLVKTN